MAQSDPFESGGEILPELSGHTAPFLLQAGRAKFSLLDDEKQAESYQRETRQKDCREEEEDLSPV